MATEDNWVLRMRDWEGSQMVVCFVRSAGRRGARRWACVSGEPSSGVTEHNSWGNFKCSLVMSEGTLPGLSRTTRMPSCCFGHGSIFKVTLVKTPRGKCTEQALNLEGVHGSLYRHGPITDEQGLFSATGNTHFFNLLILKTLQQAQCPAFQIF